MSSQNSPENLVSMNHAHCQLLADQMKTLETRVQEMETSLLAQASSLHKTITEKLDRIFDEETIIEFEPFGGDEGMIKVSNPGKKQVMTGRTQEVFDTIQATRDQLQRLNETIESLQLAR